jgi:hypothetical protein
MPQKGELKKNAKPRSVQQRKFTSKPAEKKRRAARNKARRKAIAEGKVKVGDKKDIDHRDGNPLNNSKRNVRVQARSTNRAAGGRVSGKRTASKRGKQPKRTSSR